MVYLGQCRGHRLIAQLNSYGFGEATQPDEYPPRRQPWFFDNGAFKDWSAGRPFNEKRYRTALARIRADGLRPDFVVVPDVVADAEASIALSLRWVEELRDVGPLYLVLQNGMRPESVQRHIAPFDGLFVGGTLEWKYRTAAEWADFAHAFGMKCHIGRAGTEKQVRFAMRSKADSIDSCTPLWAEANMRRFLKGFDRSQGELL